MREREKRIKSEGKKMSVKNPSENFHCIIGNIYLELRRVI